MQDMLSQTEIEIVGTHDVNGPPTEDDIKRIAGIGQVLAERIKAEP
jgi:predicted flap endonuclease-1-like 5' DNA nuclease